MKSATTRTLRLLMATAAIALPSLADAQDVVVMRRVLAPPNRAPSTPTPTPAGAGKWVVGDYVWVAGAPTCTHQAGRSRNVTCMADGTIVGNARCTEPKPAETGFTDRYDSCQNDWSVGEYGDPQPSCSANAVRTRQVVCIRHGGPITGELAPDASCTDAKPGATESGPSFAGCGYSWNAGAYSAWSAACSATATRTRSVSCVRSDGSPAGDDVCGAISAKPATVETDNTSSCPAPGTGGDTGTGVAGEWTPGAWSFVSSTPACAQNAARTRDVTCTADGKTVDVSKCTAAKPATAGEAERTDGCSFGWGIGDYGPYAPECSATSTRSRTVQCIRSGGDTVPAIAPDAACSAAGTRPQDTQTAADYASCGHGWRSGAWSPPTETCGTTTETRAVTCQRADGLVLDDGACADSGERPAATRDETIVTSCTRFDWSYGPWTYNAGGQTCSDSAAQTRTATCVSDGKALPDAYCTAPKEATSRTTARLDGCSYAWSIGEYSGYDSTCSDNATRTRTVQCRRTGGDSAPAVVEPSGCGTPVPTASESTSITSGCGYDWQVGLWSQPTDTCGANAETRSVLCHRSDDTIAPDAECTKTKDKPDTTRNDTVVTGCTFAWKYSAWAYPAGGPTCSDSTAQTRTVTGCTGNGKTMDVSYCSKITQVLTQNVARTDGCTFFWAQGGFGAYDSQCSSKATATQTVQCQRSGDGVSPSVFPDESCTGTAIGAKPDATKTAAIYGGCKLNWDAGTATHSSYCSTNVTLTYTPTCHRADDLNAGAGSTVDASLCSASGSGAGTKPATSASGGSDYSQCGYAWVIKTQTPFAPTCSNSATSSVTYQCQRSNGDIVPDASCTAAKPPATVSGSTPCGDLFADGFEGAYTWTPNYGYPSYPTTPLAHGGSKVLLLGTVASGNRSDVSSKAITLTTGKKYRLTLWSRGVSAPSSISVLPYNGSAYYFNTTTPVTASWQQYSYDFTATTTSVILRLLAGSTGVPDVMIDDVSLAQLP